MAVAQGFPGRAAARPPQQDVIKLGFPGRGPQTASSPELQQSRVQHEQHSAQGPPPKASTSPGRRLLLAGVLFSNIRIIQTAVTQAASDPTAFLNVPRGS